MSIYGKILSFSRFFLLLFTRVVIGGYCRDVLVQNKDSIPHTTEGPVIFIGVTCRGSSGGTETDAEPVSQASVISDSIVVISQVRDRMVRPVLPARVFRKNKSAVVSLLMRLLGTFVFTIERLQRIASHGRSKARPWSSIFSRRKWSPGGEDDDEGEVEEARRGHQLGLHRGKLDEEGEVEEGRRGHRLQEEKALGKIVSTGLLYGESNFQAAATADWENIVIFPHSLVGPGFELRDIDQAIARGILGALAENKHVQQITVVPVTVTYVDRDKVAVRSRVVLQYGEPLKIDSEWFEGEVTTASLVRDELALELAGRRAAAAGHTTEWGTARVAHRVLDLLIPRGIVLTPEQSQQVTSLVEGGFKKDAEVPLVSEFFAKVLEYDDVVLGMDIHQTQLVSGPAASRMIWLGTLQMASLVFLTPVAMAGHLSLLPAVVVAKLLSWHRHGAASNGQASLNEEVVYSAELMLFWHLLIWGAVFLLNKQRMLWLELGVLVVPLLGYSVVVTVETELRVRRAFLAAIPLLQFGHRQVLEQLSERRQGLADEAFKVLTFFNSDSVVPLVLKQQSVGSRRQYSINPHHILHCSLLPPVAIPQLLHWSYAHGSFMGAATMMLKDPVWRCIAALLMPAIFDDCVKCAKASRYQLSKRLIAMLENNPVMAAYGVVSTATSRGVPGMPPLQWKEDGGPAWPVWGALEWDVYLRGDLIEAWNSLTVKRGVAVEKRLLSQRLAETMLIAHGTPSQLLKEVIGINQYQSILATASTRTGGGFTMFQWMQLFGRAISLSRHSLRELEGLVVASNARDGSRVRGESTWFAGGTPIGSSFPLPGLLKLDSFSFSHSARQIMDAASSLSPVDDHRFISLEDTLLAYSEVTGACRFSVVLDVKSIGATPEIIAGLLRQLNALGVFVAAVGSFKPMQLTGLGEIRQVVPMRIPTSPEALVHRKVMGAPRPIKFFHFAGDVQQASRKGTLKAGDSVLFNGGSLLTWTTLASSRKKMASYQVMQEVVDALAKYRLRHGFSLGIYVQEADIDSMAAKILHDLINATPHIFDLGLAWGGLSGSTAGDIKATLLGAAVGRHSQEYVGKGWSRRLSTADLGKAADSDLEQARAEVASLKEQLRETEGIVLRQVRQLHAMEKKLEQAAGLYIDGTPPLLSLPQPAARAALTSLEFEKPVSTSTTPESTSPSLASIMLSSHKHSSLKEPHSRSQGSSI